VSSADITLGSFLLTGIFLWTVCSNVCAQFSKHCGIMVVLPSAGIVKISSVYQSISSPASAAYFWRAKVSYPDRVLSWFYSVL